MNEPAPSVAGARGLRRSPLRRLPGFAAPSVVWLALVLLVSLVRPAVAALAPTPLRLDDATPHIEAWPAVTMRSDPTLRLGLAEVRAAPERFGPPDGAYASLGLRDDAVWLRVPVVVAPDSNGQWMLDIDYAVLNRAEVWVVAGDRVVQHFVLGNAQPLSARPYASRSHAAPLSLPPGASATLYLRVQTLGGMVLPISFDKPSTFHLRAIDEQMLQGVLTGIGLFLLVYSLAQWASLREPMFLKYALLIGGSITFSVAQFGLGAHYLWRDNLWVELHIAGLAALVASAGTFLFVEEVLARPGRHRLFGAVMHAGAAALCATGVAYAFDWIHVHTVSLVVGSLGLLPALMGLPGAISLARRGDQVGWVFLIAWIGYYVSTELMVSLIKGRIGANWWTLHSFEIGATLDMLLFTRVLALRLLRIRSEAERMRRERDVLHSLAHSDALTGLPNRRGLAALLEAELPAAHAERPLAFLLLDLDGFKLVNDLHGHDTGDELLVAVAERLRTGVRTSDVVARLGGDEFVVAAPGLKDAAQAEALGRQLLRAFEAPFMLGERECRVGLTIGYAVAPFDGRALSELMRVADAALYAGKHSGKNTLRRGRWAEPATTN